MHSLALSRYAFLFFFFILLLVLPACIHTSIYNKIHFNVQRPLIITILPVSCLIIPSFRRSIMFRGLGARRSWGLADDKRRRQSFRYRNLLFFRIPSKRYGGSCIPVSTGVPFGTSNQRPRHYNPYNNNNNKQNC